MNRFLLRAGLGLLIIALAGPVSAANERFILWEEFGGEFSSLPPGWAVNDANSDGFLWTPWDFGAARGGCGLRYLSHPALAADDWVFTEAVDLRGKT